MIVDLVTIGEKQSLFIAMVSNYSEIMITDIVNNSN